MTWACAAAGRRTDIASAAEKQCSDQGRMHLSFTSSAPNAPRQYAYAPNAAASASRWLWFSSNHNYFLLPPADRPNGHRLFSRQLNFFGFVSDHKAFACTERVFHLLQTDFDFEHLAAVGHGKPKYGVILRRATGPK